jgi:hypothetical protein
MRSQATIQVNLRGKRATNLLGVNMEATKELLLFFLLTKEEGIQLCKPNNLDLVIYVSISYQDPIKNSEKAQIGAMTTLSSQLRNW